jgi:GNAT superfamily N-acetyltransferase
MAGNLVRDLQERSARALPAGHVERTGGWWLRHAPGCSWWAGSVLPHGESDVAHGVAAAEKFHAARGTPVRFQITPGACPGDLDAHLAGRGYLRESPMSLRVARTAGVRDRVAGRVVLAGRPERAWFEAWHSLLGDGTEPAAEWDLLARVELPSAYARAMAGDEVVAVGRAVADTGWAGLFGMATIPRARGTGAARTVLAALATWAHTQGADQLYLQVDRDNAPALRLYERAGFTELAAYHYRLSS